MIGRRKMLGLLGMTPLAAKAAAEQEVAGLTQLRGSPLPRGRLPDPIELPGMNSRADHTSQLATYVRTFGLPAHVEREVRRQARYVTSLDPDIACKRSWSLNVKIQHQRERNVEYQIERYAERDWWQKAQKQFKVMTGLDWYP